MTPYGKDLAYIHDRGHREFALSAAPGLLHTLRRNGIAGGLVVDLGCGSGVWAAELNRAGYDVFGIDISPGMIQLARRNAPRATFAVGSFLSERLPSCNAVTAVGEVLNYAFDRRNGPAALRRLFKRVHRSLNSGGVFAFDIATPQRLPASGVRRHWSAGPDWAVMSATSGSEDRSVLRREIVAFRKSGRGYRRSEEVHHQLLLEPADIVRELESCGFAARAWTRYGSFRLPEGLRAIVAIKDESRPHQPDQQERRLEREAQDR